MLFKLSYTIRRLDLRGDQSLDISLPNSDEIRLIYRPPSNEEREIGHKSYNAFLDVIGDFKPTKNSLPIFAAMLEGRRPKEAEKALSSEQMIHRDGPEYGLDYYPNPFIDFVCTVNNKLASAGRSVTSILRWRYAQEGESSPINSRGTFCFNESKDCWVPVPNRFSVSSVTPRQSLLNPSKVDGREITKLLKTNNTEPLAHELLREAKELQYKSRRSSVLIAVSAAEVAIKSVVVERIPDASWLIEDYQAPPIVDILINFFPTLFSAKEIFYKPTKKEGIVKTIFDAVHIRNQMVHKGEAPPCAKKVASILEDIEILIWGCDFLSGHKWALSNVPTPKQDGL